VFWVDVAMVLVTAGDEQSNCNSGAETGSITSNPSAGGDGMEKAWGVTVAPPPQQHKRPDPAPWHKHDLTEKERAKQLRKFLLICIL
jgi:hypothetical protein